LAGFHDSAEKRKKEGEGGEAERGTGAYRIMGLSREGKQ